MSVPPIESTAPAPRGRRRAARWALAGGVLAVLIVVGVLVTKGPPAPGRLPPDGFAFAAMGDAPYLPWEAVQERLVVRDLDANDLAFVVHVGDIFWRPCSDASYRRQLERFDRIEHPVVYTPGDNEWTDCWQAGAGGHDPLERLEFLRQVLFAEPSTSLGAQRMPLESQGEEPRWSEFVENARWSRHGVVFATVDLPGSVNALGGYPGRRPADDAAARRRTEAVVAWIRETFADAEAQEASAVVVAFHANPYFEEAPEHRDRAPYDPFILALEEGTTSFGRPVLAIHGDFHEYMVDHPLVRRTTGRTLANFTRLQVPGSPRVGWVRVVVRPGATPVFAFEERVVPPWKYW